MKCPNCGETITNSETLNTEWYHNKYYDYLAGTCECGKIYTWTEVYEYVRDEDIVEVNDYIV